MITRRFVRSRDAFGDLRLGDPAAVMKKG